jgi:hypothetical protein
MKRYDSIGWAKKGSERDIMMIVTICLTIGILALIVIKFVSMFNAQIQDKSDIPQIAKDVSTTINTRLPKWMDGAFIMLYIFLMIVALILALMVESNPIMLPISILFMLFVVLISFMAANIWNSLVLNENLATEAASLPIMSFMIPKLHIFSFIIGMGILVLMVAKRS